MNIDLTLVWAFIIVFAVFVYVVMDGFDLGIGILFPQLQVGVERDTAMNSVAPVWDGNETWLVLGGGGLLAAFPLAYGIILSALYTPIIAMLLALVFRGVAFEFRWRDPGHRAYWDVAFAGGSTLAAFSQGIILGALLQGVEVSGRAYAGGWWSWLTPFSVLTGVSVVVAYALLGATWRILKSEGELQRRCVRLAGGLGVATLLAIAVVSGATPFLKGAYFARWLSFPNILQVAPVPLLVLGTATRADGPICLCVVPCGAASSHIASHCATTCPAPAHFYSQAIDSAADFASRAESLKRLTQESTREVAHMNEDTIKGNWKQFTGKVQEQWGKLTNDDLDVIDGKREQFVGKVQERTGVARDVAEQQVKDWHTRNPDFRFND